MGGGASDMRNNHDCKFSYNAHSNRNDSHKPNVPTRGACGVQNGYSSCLCKLISSMGIIWSTISPFRYCYIEEHTACEGQDAKCLRVFSHRNGSIVDWHEKTNLQK